MLINDVEPAGRRPERRESSVEHLRRDLSGCSGRRERGRDLLESRQSLARPLQIGVQARSHQRLRSLPSYIGPELSLFLGR